MGSWTNLKSGMKFKELGSGYIYKIGSPGVRIVSGENLIMWSLSNLTDGRYVSDVKEETIQRWIIVDEWAPVNERLLSSSHFEELQKSEIQKRFEAALDKVLDLNLPLTAKFLESRIQK